ncbi:MAG: DUF4925 domain-containing protein [Phocaeicola sp.]
MKKNFYYGLAFMFSLGILSSCSNEDENEDNEKLELLKELNTSFKTNDEENKLELTYSEASLLGKTATFTSTDGKTATIELAGNTITELNAILGTDLVMPGVVPGETTTTLKVELVEDDGDSFSFEGTDEANGRTINYKGEIEKGKLTLDLNVVLEKNELTGSTWNLKPTIYEDFWGTEQLNSTPISLKWESEKIFDLGFAKLNPGEMMAITLGLVTFDNGAGTKINAHKAIANLLQSLTFMPDGNVVAKYSDADNLASPVWQDSPLNLVHYIVKEGKVYAFLNIDAIIALSKDTEASSKSASSIMPEVMKIIIPKLPKLIPMLSNGIPLGYRIEEGTTGTKKFSVFIDNELGMILKEIIIEVLQNEEIVTALKEMMANDPEFGSMASMAKPIFTQGPEVFGSTTQIELGLNFDEPAK